MAVVAEVYLCHTKISSSSFGHARSLQQQRIQRNGSVPMCPVCKNQRPTSDAHRPKRLHCQVLEVVLVPGYAEPSKTLRVYERAQDVLFCKMFNVCLNDARNIFATF